MSLTIKAEHIKKSYGNKTVLNDISFEACSGQCIGILGANGCGKSTLLSILAGVLKADSGSWLVDQKWIGYVPQGNPLMEELTAMDNLRLWYCDSPKDLKQELKTGVLAMLGIPDFIHVPVRKMSGGMKKRLSIGCAIAMDPKILIMDEPSASLDLICKERIHNYLKDFKKQRGIILLATHEEQEINLCDKLLIMKQGVFEPYKYDGNIHRLVGQLVSPREKQP